MCLMIIIYLHNVSGDNDLILFSEDILPKDSFTYVSEAHHTVSWPDHCISTADAHHTVSWPDHCISTADAHASTQNIEVFYNLASTDHILVCITIDVTNMLILSDQTNNYA